MSDRESPRSPASVRRLLTDGLFEAMGESAANLAGAGTTLAATDNRRDTGFVAVYQFDGPEHGAGRTVLWCDPAVAGRIESMADPDHPLPDADLREWATQRSLDVIGQSVMKTLGRPLPPRAVPDEATPVRFCWSNESHMDLMRALVARSSAVDLDEAEIDIDELDELAVGLLHLDGSIGAFASARAWEFEPHFGDIGVLVAASRRGHGWGTGVVSLLVEALLAEGLEPLYRCDHVVNTGSDRLSAALGFVPVTHLTAVRLGPGASVE